MLAQKKLDGFFVPRVDEHRGEAVAPHSERLAWLTGFTGSAGFAIILQKKAALFVDGRYTLQAAQQVDADLFDVCPLAEIHPAKWLESHLESGQHIGFDPWLHSESEIEKYLQVCENKGAELVLCDQNLVDGVWPDQPPEPKGLIAVHDIKYSGQTAQEKIEQISQNLGNDQIDAAVMTLLDSIAWLLNIRGQDIPCSPLFLANAIIYKDGTVQLFVDPKKIDSAVRAHLPDTVVVKSKSEFSDELMRLGQKQSHVLVDSHSAPFKVIDLLSDAGAEVIDGEDPCLLPKACKNEVEVVGMKNSHVRDGAALTTFLSWLHRTVPQQSVTELDAVEQLLSCRQAQENFMGVSFDTISGAGPNGAIVHYRVNEKTSRVIEPDMMYLVDSGGQYLDGTTDVTRTVLIGEPTQEQRDRYTRVLKGHIAIAMAKFPVGTKGTQLDTLARSPLWQIGLDYEHGTGHGVGCYLNVHEGPQNIGKPGRSDTALQPGMIVSNEPGYYKTGAYGIRIESLVAVVQLEKASKEHHEILGFETITKAPLCRALIDHGLLSEQELAWVNRYHEKIRKILSPLVDLETAAWLDNETQIIG